MTRLSHTLLCCWILGALATAPNARPALAGEMDQAKAQAGSEESRDSLASSLQPHELNEPVTANSPEAMRESGAPAEPHAEPAAAATARSLPPRSTTHSTTGGTSDRRWIDVPRGTWRTIGSLALIIGLIVALRSVMTRFGGPLARARAPSGIIEVLGRFPLSRGQTLLLIKVDRRVLLLSQAGGSLTTLSEITDAEQVASLLQRLRHERGDSFTRRFEELATPVTDRSDAALSSSDEIPVVVDLTRKARKTPAQRIASLFAEGGRR